MRQEGIEIGREGLREGGRQELRQGERETGREGNREGDREGDRETGGQGGRQGGRDGGGEGIIRPLVCLGCMAKNLRVRDYPVNNFTAGKYFLTCQRSTTGNFNSSSGGGGSHIPPSKLAKIYCCRKHDINLKVVANRRVILPWLGSS